MLKTNVGGQIWLVEQPDHARLSGYLAAHWGGVNGFARPGCFPGATRPEAWREEVVLAIAQHDNGWWEWEAMPQIDPESGLPLHLTDVAARTPEEGLGRWRLGVPRLAASHPYAALLISLHAYWLYAFAFPERITPESDAYRHPLFGTTDSATRLVSAPEPTRRFLNEQSDMQAELGRRLADDEVFAAALRPEHRDAHLKLLQLFDAMSLLASFGLSTDKQFEHVPRASWHDRIRMHWRPQPDGTIVCDPYPFDCDPLPVFLPVRIVSADEAGTPAPPLVRLHGTPVQTLRFEVCSGATLPNGRHSA